MAIEVNGVSLPDIPADVLSQYPYAVIATIGYEGEVEIYALYLSDSPYLYLDASLIGETGEAIVTLGNSIRYTYVVDNPNAEYLGYGWIESSSVISELFYLGVNQTNDYYGEEYLLVWANHDIGTVTSVDGEGNPVLDGIYFLKSVTFEEEYSAPGTWFEGMANGIRKLTGSVKRYTTDEMLNALENPPQATSMTISNFLSGGGGVYLVNLMGIKIANLEGGKTYKVEIDGNVCECTAIATSYSVMLGNMYLVSDTLADTGEPIMIMVTDNDGGTSSIYTNVGSDASHTISIMEMPSEST